MSSSIDSFSTGCADLSVASFPSSEAGRRSFAAIARDRAAGLRDGKSVIASCMPYTPLRVAADAPEILHRFVRQHIDPLLADVRFLLSIRRPDQAEKGSLQRPMGAMLLICADGAAQLLYPGKPRMREVERFKGFLLAYYPWTLDPPENLLPEQAVEILWFFYRCPIVHRFGAVHDTNPAPLINKVGNIFIGDEATLDRCEQPGERPFSRPAVVFGNGRTVLWAEAFYWGIRQAIESALDDRSAWPAVEHHLATGSYARKTPAFPWMALSKP